MFEYLKEVDFDNIVYMLDLVEQYILNHDNSISRMLFMLYNNYNNNCTVDNYILLGTYYLNFCE